MSLGTDSCAALRAYMHSIGIKSLAHLKDPATVLARIIDEQLQKYLDVHKKLDILEDKEFTMSISGYTKLFSTIVTSSIWQEPKENKVLWITMLALANKDGIVEASVPGLANVAGLTIEETEHGLAMLLSPDQYSRSKVADGRRIEAIDGGWLLVNHRKYRDKLSADERREYYRKNKAEHRKKEQMSTNVHKCPQMSRMSTHTDTDTDTKADTDTKKGANAPLGGKAKPRNELMDSLAECCGMPVSEIGGVASRLMKVLKAIKASTPDVTPQEIVRRAANYRSQFRDAILTPEAMGKHWSMCHSAKHNPGSKDSQESNERLNSF